MAEAEQLFQAVALVGGTLTGVVSVIVALGKARELANKPLEVLKSDLTAQVTAVKTELDKATSSIREGIQAVRKESAIATSVFEIYLPSCTSILDLFTRTSSSSVNKPIRERIFNELANRT